MNQPLPRVMIIDDDIIMHDVMKMMLQSTYNLRLCFQVRQAIDLLDSWQPEVICVDLMMPGENGLVLLEYCKRHEQYAHIPVIVISASSDDQFFNEARRMGAHSLVFKPFSRIDLIRAINAALETPDA